LLTWLTVAFNLFHQRLSVLRSDNVTSHSSEIASIVSDEVKSQQPTIFAGNCPFLAGYFLNE
jgi:hypothetical protein